MGTAPSGADCHCSADRLGTMCVPPLTVRFCMEKKLTNRILILPGGGIGYSGPTSCVAGSSCSTQNSCMSPLNCTSLALSRRSNFGEKTTPNVSRAVETAVAVRQPRPRLLDKPPRPPWPPPPPLQPRPQLVVAAAQLLLLLLATVATPSRDTSLT